MNTSHNYHLYSKEYAQLGITGTYILAFKPLEKILRSHITGKEALDYGCGTGRSTQFLISQGFKTTGVDISREMLEQAKTNGNNANYVKIASGMLPFARNQFDLIFSSFVFIEIADLRVIEAIFRAFYRVLAKTGKVVVITTSEPGYNTNTVSFSYDFPENKKSFRSGEKVKLNIKGTRIILFDYFWTRRDYARVFSNSRFRIVNMLSPLGTDYINHVWLDEARVPPFDIYLLEKIHQKNATP